MSRVLVSDKTGFNVPQAVLACEGFKQYGPRVLEVPDGRHGGHEKDEIERAADQSVRMSRTVCESVSKLT